MWHFCDCVGPSLKCCVPPPQEVKSMFECLFNYKHFIVDLLAQPIVAIVTFITIIVCKFVLQTSDLHRTRTGCLAWLMFADISVLCLVYAECGYSGQGWPGSAQAVTSGPVPMVMIDPWLWLAGDCLTSHTEHHHITESNTSREQRAGPALTPGCGQQTQKLALIILMINCSLSGNNEGDASLMMTWSLLTVLQLPAKPDIVISEPDVRY